MHRLFAAALVLGVCLVGQANAETRNLSGFNAVTAADGIDIVVAVGPSYTVEVTGRDASRVRTRLEGDTLSISDSERSWFGRTVNLDAVVRVTTPRLDHVAAARGADLQVTLGSTCDDFTAAAAMGASARVVGARCGTIDASASMGGELRLEGACARLDASASMGGTLRAENLTCETVDIAASMGGDVRAYASRNYDASASMGGSIQVSGEGAETGRATLMGGSIRNSR